MTTAGTVRRMQKIIRIRNIPNLRINNKYKMMMGTIYKVLRGT
jgi:hypothetical protein